MERGASCRASVRNGPYRVACTLFIVRGGHRMGKQRERVIMWTSAIALPALIILGVWVGALQAGVDSVKENVSSLTKKVDGLEAQLKDSIQILFKAQLDTPPLIPDLRDHLEGVWQIEFADPNSVGRMSIIPRPDGTFVIRAECTELAEGCKKEITGIGEIKANGRFEITYEAISLTDGSTHTGRMYLEATSTEMLKGFFENDHNAFGNIRLLKSGS